MKRSPLRRKTPLQRKTALRARTKPTRPSAKRKLESLPSLIKKADTAFSRYVRLRDSEYIEGEWLGVCITCPRRVVVIDRVGHWGLGVDAGHFISRGKKIIRWDELNVNLQCRHCNIWRDKEDMIAAYKKALNIKYGDQTWQRLKREGAKDHKPTREELRQIISDSKTYIEYALQNPYNYSIL